MSERMRYLKDKSATTRISGDAGGDEAIEANGEKRSVCRLWKKGNEEVMEETDACGDFCYPLWARTEENTEKKLIESSLSQERESE